MVESHSKLSASTVISFHNLRGEDVEAVKDQVVAVYAAAFAGPPYNRTAEVVIDFANSLPRHAHRDAFRLVAARDDSSGRMVGFDYGFSALPGQWWYDVVSTVMGSEQRARWLADAFELTELAVLPEYQGYGIGGRLHDQLLAGLAHRTAVLSTIHIDTPAYHLYHKRGWVTLLDKIMFPNVIHSYRIMGLDLKTA